MVGVRRVWVVRTLGWVQVPLALAFVSVVVLTFTSKRPVVEHASSSVLVPDTSPTPDPLPELAWYAPLWQRDLRQPPIPPPAPVAERALPTLLPELAGTFVESERSFAHLRLVNGTARIVPLGGTCEGYELVGVESGRACLRVGDNQQWIEVARPEPPVVVDAGGRP